MGNGLDDGVALGPLVNAEGRDKVIELVDDAVSEGREGADRRQAAGRRRASSIRRPCSPTCRTTPRC